MSRVLLPVVAENLMATLLLSDDRQFRYLCFERQSMAPQLFGMGTFVATAPKINPFDGKSHGVDGKVSADPNLLLPENNDIIKIAISVPARRFANVDSRKSNGV